MAIPLTKQIITGMRQQAQKASRRFFFLDYDGVLAEFAPRPEAAVPTPQLLTVLERLGALPQNQVAIVSGRTKENLEAWFGHLPLRLYAEHGLFCYDGAWKTLNGGGQGWKPKVRQLMEQAVAAAPGSFIEEKHASLCWHYRLARPKDASTALCILQHCLSSSLRTLPASKAFEVQGGSSATKAAAIHQATIAQNDFVFVAGDDPTDETMFAAAPPQAFTIKVRNEPTAARFTAPAPRDILAVLLELAQA